MSRFTEYTPKSRRELEQFFLETQEKISGTDTTLGDEELKSTVPFMSLLRDLTRRVDQLEARTDRLNKKKGVLIDLERRLTDLERGITIISALSEIKRDIEDLKRSV
jgi:hypothetical protein